MNEIGFVVAVTDDTVSQGEFLGLLFEDESGCIAFSAFNATASIFKTHHDAERAIARHTAMLGDNAWSLSFFIYGVNDADTND